MRAVITLLAAAAILAGCGAVSDRPGEERSIRAVDRAAPDAHKAEAEVRIEVSLDSGWDPCEEPPTAENVQLCEEQRELERYYRAEEEREKADHEEAHAPSKGTEARVVAELPLERGGIAEVVAWRARNGKTCTLARITPDQRDGMGARRVGACVRFTPCTDLCLTVLTTNDRRGVLAGTVPDQADVLRLIGPDGAERDYELSGPVIDGSDLRVFIADLGAEDWWTAELRRGDETLAADETLGPHLRGLRCASESTEEVYACYATEPLPPQPTAADDDERETACERQFDETEAGFQTCEDEGDTGESE